ncbi:MAG: tetratricopeptide repeat protein [bacterium]|nr:tetratricopeptide repeat protein [bacterium]
MSNYSLNDAANILKVSPARLRHWKRTTLAQAQARAEQPAAGVAATVGPDFDFRDLVCVRAMLALVDRGISVRRIRRAVTVLNENIPDLDDPLAALRLWSDGSERIVVQHDGVLIEPEGQMVLDFSGGGGAAADPASISDRPKDPNQMFEEVLSLFEKGCSLDSDPASYEQAKEAYERCLEIDPGFADAHCNLGAVLYNAGKPAPARRCFERCLEINARHVEAHFNLANLLEEEGCNEMAMSHYRAAQRADPFYAELHVNMALLYERMASPHSGLDHWRRYLQLDPTGAWSEVARQRLSGDKSR